MRILCTKAFNSGSFTFCSVNYKIWLRKENLTVVTFDAGRRLSGVGIILLAYATAGDPSSIEHLKLDKSDFIELKNWLLTNDGQIRRITFQKIEHQDMKFKQIVLSAHQLEKFDLFLQLLNSSQVITNMSFLTSPLNVSNRPLCCRINYWGGLTIYILQI